MNTKIDKKQNMIKVSSVNIIDTTNKTKQSTVLNKAALVDDTETINRRIRAGASPNASMCYQNEQELSEAERSKRNIRKRLAEQLNCNVDAVERKLGQSKGGPCNARTCERKKSLSKQRSNEPVDPIEQIINEGLNACRRRPSHDKRVANNSSRRPKPQPQRDYERDYFDDEADMRNWQEWRNKQKTNENCCRVDEQQQQEQRPCNIGFEVYQDECEDNVNDQQDCEPEQQEEPPRDTLRIEEELLEVEQRRLDLMRQLQQEQRAKLMDKERRQRGARPPQMAQNRSFESPTAQNQSFESSMTQNQTFESSTAQNRSFEIMAAQNRSTDSFKSPSTNKNRAAGSFDTPPQHCRSARALVEPLRAPKRPEAANRIRRHRPQKEQPLPDVCNESSDENGKDNCPRQSPCGQSTPKRRECQPVPTPKSSECGCPMPPRRQSGISRDDSTACIKPACKPQAKDNNDQAGPSGQNDGWNVPMQPPPLDSIEYAYRSGNMPIVCPPQKSNDPCNHNGR